MKLDMSFFENIDTVILARNLIGKVLVYESDKGIIRGIINETEAYREDDESCHAYNGKRTSRNEIMFKRAGHLYVYFTYGMYHCCNVVTGLKDKGEAVLIRSVIPIDGVDVMKKNRGRDSLKGLVDGPAKLCIAYGFDRESNGIDLLDESSKVYVEDVGIVAKKIDRTRRIGISKSQELEWRFIANEFEGM